MSLLGSALGRGIAGVAGGAQSLASKYIDEELAAQRAQALEDMKFASAKRLEEFQQSPEVQGRRRDNATADTVAAGAAADTVSLNRANNALLTEATIRQKVAVTEGTAEAEAKAAGQKKRAESENSAYDLSPGQQRYIGREKLTENSRATSQEVQADLYREGLKRDGDADPLSKLPPGVKAKYASLDAQIKAIDGAMVKAQAEGQWEPEKNTGQRDLQKRRAALSIQQGALIQPYLSDGGGNADPLGIFSAPSKADMVKAAAAANGDTDYVVELEGKRTTVGSPGRTPPAARGDEGPGLLSRAWSAVKDAASAPPPNLRAHALSALAAGDKATIRSLLQTPGAAEQIDGATLTKMRSALGA